MSISWKEDARMTTNWRQELNEALQANNEKAADIIFSTLTEEQANEEFDNGYGAIQGCPFTAWTAHYVYFPACYDGQEWVTSVRRFPIDLPTEHIGGG